MQEGSQTDAKGTDGKKSRSFEQDVWMFGAFGLAGGTYLVWKVKDPFWQHMGVLAIKAGGGLLVLFIFLPYVWKHRHQILSKLWSYVRLTVRWIFGLSGRGQGKATAVQPVTDPVMAVSGGVAANSAVVTDDHRAVRMLEAPFSLLPHNPKPRPGSTLTKENAADFIAGALQLVGLTIDNPLEVLAVESGPTLQTVSFRLPPKVQLSALMKKQDDLANHLGCHSGFDVVNAKYQSSAAFVIPHQDRAFVYLRDTIVDPRFQTFVSEAQLPVVFGLDLLGKPIYVDLAKLPHLLVAGATGSGKSVFINAVLDTLLLCRSPDELRLLLIDPKMVELNIYNGFPHLLAPPVTDMRRAALALNKVIVEMEKRYERFAKADVRNIQQYNRKDKVDKLPYIVTVIDEYADLMLVAGDVVEDAVQRYTQMGRAAGIHLILATQRPSVDVVTGVIKANLPSRVSFRLQSSHDFRTVMDSTGPHLMGKGDGITMMDGGMLVRFQSASVSVDDGEATTLIEDLKGYWNSQTARNRAVPGWDIDKEEDEDEDATRDDDRDQSLVHDEQQLAIPMAAERKSDSFEEQYAHAVKLAREHKSISIADLQRQSRVGYSVAQKILERMEAEGVVGPYDSATQSRKLLEATEEKQTDEQLLERIRYFVCTTRSARTADLRNVLGIKMTKLLELMQLLVEDGFLLAPTSRSSGYLIGWDEEQMKAFLDDHLQEE